MMLYAQIVLFLACIEFARWQFDDVGWASRKAISDAYADESRNAKTLDEFRLISASWDYWLCPETSR